MFDKEEITDFTYQEDDNIMWVIFDCVMMSIPIIYFILSIFMWR